MFLEEKEGIEDFVLTVRNTRSFMCEKVKNINFARTSKLNEQELLMKF